MNTLIMGAIFCWLCAATHATLTILNKKDGGDLWPLGIPAAIMCSLLGFLCWSANN